MQYVFGLWKDNGHLEMSDGRFTLHIELLPLGRNKPNKTEIIFESYKASFGDH